MHATPSADALVLTRSQVRQVDRLAIDELGIPGIVLMENAAASLEAAARELVGRYSLSRVILVCGPGNNGGDGFALARRLRVRFTEDELRVEILLGAPRERYSGDALANLEIADRMGLLPAHEGTLSDASPEIEPPMAARTFFVDALLGTGASRPPEGRVAALVRWINGAGESGARVLAIDVPTGLDCDTGAPLGDEDLVVRADQTVTLCAMKLGLTEVRARRFTGAVSVGEIGVPRELIARCAAL